MERSQTDKQNEKGDSFGLKGANANNLKNIDIDFYSRQIIAIKGVSGSGKSSLIKEVLYSSWLKNRPVNCTSVNGLGQFSDLLLIDQEAMRQNRLSTPASYTGIIEQLKTLSMINCPISVEIVDIDRASYVKFVM